jgi:peptidyl-prolyl cis-trans isomerase D
MLIAIRERAKGWFAWLLVIAIVIPLAFFGMYSYFSGPSASELAVVNGTEISADQLNNAYQQQRRQLEQMFGGQLDPALFDERQLRREALEGLINQALLRSYVRDQGYRVSDSTLAAVIRSEQAFQENGRFSPELYRVLLRNNGLTPQAYEASVRLGETVDQLQGGIFGSAFVADAEVDRLMRLQRQERELTYLTVKADAFRDQVQISEEEIKQYYTQNSELFQRPEQVKLSYVELSPEAVAGKVAIGEDELRARYEEVKTARFTQGGERGVRHVLLQLPEDATAEQVAAAEEKLRELRQRIVSGDLSFEAAAREVSEDPGSAEAGGDLGLVSRGQMVEGFERAAFALEEGAVSEPVRTEFGLHLIQVTEVTPTQVQPFEQVKDELRQAMVAERADNQLVEMGNRLANIAYEQPDSLVPAAEKLGLELRQTDWISRQAPGEGIAANPKVIEAAFSDDLLRLGRNSSVIELEDGRSVVVRVAEHQPAEPRPLEEVAADIREQLTLQKTAAAAQERGAELRQQLEADAAPGQLAKTPAVELAQPGFVGRGNTEVPPEVLRAAFRLPRPAQDAASVSGVQLRNGDFAVLQVSAVREAAAGEQAEQLRQTLRQQLQAMHGNIAIRGLLETLREHADIEINEERL